ncbi:MAG: hypothetical protein [Caudoviricetes sp.]|nr:MAG: hypothetical protein [Caudoviricetes sp.]
MNIAIRELEKDHWQFCLIQSRSSNMCFWLLVATLKLFACLGSYHGINIFILWIFALFLIYMLFKNAMDAAELGY